MIFKIFQNSHLSPISFTLSFGLIHNRRFWYHLYGIFDDCEVPSAISCSQFRSADSFDWHIRVLTRCISTESHLLLRLMYSCSLIKVGFLFLLISFVTERWEPVCEARGGKQHVVLWVSLLLSVGSIKSTGWVNVKQQGECPEPCAGGRPTKPVGGWRPVCVPARPCSVLAVALLGSGLSMQPDALLPRTLQMLCVPLQQIPEVRVHLQTYEIKPSPALITMHGVFLDLGLRAVQGINLSKWEWQQFILCEHKNVMVIQNGMESGPSHFPSVGAWGAPSHLLWDWKPHWWTFWRRLEWLPPFCFLTFCKGLMHCLQFSSPIWIVLFHVTYIIKRWKQKLDLLLLLALLTYQNIVVVFSCFCFFVLNLVLFGLLFFFEVF